ncbi:hypothetical protein [Actinophytocola gossypii]|uniref:Uncharacterized protein n=1 Tax=Actinophytocola gossypii TaxID=2812003 RepID=A0ABT2J1D5_9PSEU|nr:hypothetical protein [Actinophytocola gossypii]MCT2581675.1 hypothetical protein [Actinophytocola gossypii]
MNTTITQVLHAATRPLTGRHLATRPGILRAAAAFTAALVALFLVWSGWLYPLRPDVIDALSRPLDPLLPGAWGGPTLLGAWAVHALIALAIQAVCVAVIHATQGRPT